MASLDPEPHSSYSLLRDPTKLLSSSFFTTWATNALFRPGLTWDDSSFTTSTNFWPIPRKSLFWVPSLGHASGMTSCLRLKWNRLPNYSGKFWPELNGADYPGTISGKNEATLLKMIFLFRFIDFVTGSSVQLQNIFRDVGKLSQQPGNSFLTVSA